MANVNVNHKRVAGTPPNSSVIVDGPAWDAGHVVTGLENVPNVDTTKSSNINFTQNGTGAVSRSVSAKLTDMVSVKDFGAVGDGVTDDSAAFTAALTSGANNVYVPATGTYLVHDVTIPNGVTLSAYGAKFIDTGGASYIFKLTGFSAKLLGAYVSSALNCSTAAVVLDDGHYLTVTDVNILNATTGVKLQSTLNGATGGCTKAFLSNIQIDSFSGYGFYFGPNVHDANCVNLYADANTISGGGGQIPKTGTTGFALVGTGSVAAFGGNQFTNTTAINCQTAYSFVDANLDCFNSMIGDTCSGAGISISGATTNMIFGNVAIGTCGAGVVHSGSASSNQFNGLRTNNTGVIPSFGGTTFYSSAGFSAPFFDLTQSSTGQFSVNADNWVASGANAHSLSEAVAGAIQINGGVILPFNSNGTVAAGLTVFLGQNGQNATENNVIWCQPQSAQFYVVNAARVIIQNGTAPGAGQSFSYTLRVNNADSAITATTSGAGVFQATVSGGPISIGPLKPIAIKLVTSGAAASSAHRGYIQLIPQPS